MGNKNEIKISDYRLIPSGSGLWSIDLQANIYFKKDSIVEITNTIYGTDDYFYGKIKELLFDIPGFIPTYIDKVNGNIGIEFSKTLPYTKKKYNDIDQVV